MRFLFFIFILLFGCDRNIDGNTHANKEDLSNELLFKISMKLKKEKKLQPFGRGAEAFDEIKMLYLSFQYYEQMDIDDARGLLIEAVHIFLKSINEEGRIRPYLKNYPFEPKNIEMSIFFKKPDGSAVDPNKLCLVFLNNQGKLRYEKIDPETNHLITIHTETYGEAEERIEKVTTPSPI